MRFIPLGYYGTEEDAIKAVQFLLVSRSPCDTTFAGGRNQARVSFGKT